jgi:dehydrogenase/reductase SDR family protein 1
MPFWELPISSWDELTTVGLRSHFVASMLAAPLMISQASGLIVFMSSRGASRYASPLPYGVTKAGMDKMAADMAIDLRPHGVAAISIWPRLTKTELVLAQPDVYDVSGTRAATPQFTGRAIAALAADPDVLQQSGRALPVIDLAGAYGFTDVDGTLPDW